jgi:polar amino acid transport system substrate-binding protein
MHLRPALRTLLLMVCCLGAVAEERFPVPDNVKVLRAAYVEFPPLTYTDDEGKPAGRYIELSEKVATAAGYRLHWRAIPIRRVYQFLKEGHLDFWPGVAGLPSLQSSVIESTHTLKSLTLSAFYLPPVAPVSGFRELQGHRVILMSGYTYLGTLDALRKDPTTDFYSAPGHEEGLQMLRMGRGDYFLDYQEPMAEVLKEHPDSRVQSSELMKSRLAYMLSRRTPNALEVMQRLDAAYVEVVGDAVDW